ncbi:hypothetical protein [Lactococcus sp. DD01]|nr:hypothetical protein [Lactococcus sp. DD01]KXT59345.1 hypothetical protein LACDD01_02142 [Lactococcus sp. DD01]
MTPEDYKVIADDSYRVDKNVRDRRPLYAGDEFKVNGKKMGSSQNQG